jgi:K+-transporting ATPase ATPase C chain
MIASVRPALVLTLLFTLLTGLAYPLAITGVASVIAPGSAEGSLVRRDGAVIGSSLIGQEFTSNRYFHPRPSATSAPDPRDSTQSIDAPYNAANSSGSNLGPLSRKLLDRLQGDVERLRQRGEASIPADLATASGSGLDPDISPAAARLQVALVASARGLPEAQVLSIVENHVEGRWLGLLGEPRVNVLLLNLALDGVK